MSQPIIEVTNLSKVYRLGEIGASSLRDEANAFWERLRGRRQTAGAKEFWALRDVSFDVRPGEVVGIIGRNGAGKSTLLKILSRITEPTSGRAVLRGRVASLLEVGTGFHPDLSGRDNIFLNGAILGMTRAEIRSRFDEIVAFAEVDKFIDTPVKRYSSGMYVRLAFAVAAHLEPEILIVDEVLAVGDFAFQQKCIGKMQAVAGQEGRTVLFVSHNMQAVTGFCTRAVLLDSGRVSQVGATADVAAAYIKLLGQAERLTVWHGDRGDESFRLRAARIASAGSGAFRTDEPLRLQFVGQVLRPISGLVFAIEVYSAQRQLLAYSAHDDIKPPPAADVPAGPFAWELVIPANTFAPGTYEFRLDVGIHNAKHLIEERISLTVSLENVGGIGRRFPGWTQCFRPDWEWRNLPSNEVGELLAEAPPAAPPAR